MDLEKQTILIVDDERLNLDILTRELRNEYRVLVAKDGRQALQRLESNRVDLVMLDIVLPGMDGFEIIKIMKGRDSWLDVPVIFITAKSEVEDEAIGLQLGAADYIRKPFNIPIVRARVKTHMDLRRKGLLLEKLASLDPLTSLPNRRKVDETVLGEWKRSERTLQPISLIFIDIDFFKKFNDQYGHRSGDECLRQVALQLKSGLLRESDFIGRYGGEEFLGILPVTESDSAAGVAERLRRGVESLGIPHIQNTAAPCVTISLGVASTVPDAVRSSPQQLLDAADQMLYESKTQGRNRVTCRQL